MRVLFVENRYATRLYREVAAHLQANGHEIHWIVQNPLFRTTVGTSHTIAFPSARAVKCTPEREAVFARIAGTDRQILYFGRRTTHYQHYFSCIDAIIDRVRPDVVFGESTQFYELLTIESCRERAIQYLNPVTVGCPAGRLYFLSYDTKDPIGGDQTVLTRAAATELLNAINQRRFAPNYMGGSPISSSRRLAIRLADWLRITGGWALGEHFATPSPMRKMRLELSQRKTRRKWEDLAQGYSGIDEPYVLYALHVQPECSIDVWGGAWRDQAEIIRRAAVALASAGIALAVKPHPNAKYEVTDRLCEIVAASPNIRPIPGRVPIREVFPTAMGILGVTGTVLLEAVFAGKAAISVGPNAMSRYPGISEITTPEGVVDALQRANKPDRSPDTKAIELLQWLYRVSYPGEMFEPLFSPERLLNGHMEPLCAAFSDVASQVARSRPAARLAAANARF